MSAAFLSLALYTDFQTPYVIEQFREEKSGLRNSGASGSFNASGWKSSLSSVLICALLQLCSFSDFCFPNALSRSYFMIFWSKISNGIREYLTWRFYTIYLVDFVSPLTDNCATHILTLHLVYFVDNSILDDGGSLSP